MIGLRAPAVSHLKPQTSRDKPARFTVGVLGEHFEKRKRELSKPFVTKTTPEGAAYDAASLRLPLADVDRNGCRFPVNDAPTAAGILFCGHPVHAKRYCEHHLARAYRCADAT